MTLASSDSTRLTSREPFICAIMRSTGPSLSMSPRIGASKTNAFRPLSTSTRIYSANLRTAQPTSVAPILAHFARRNLTEVELHAPQPDLILFAIIDKVRDDALAGVIRLLDASAHNLSMEIGLVLSPAFQRTSRRTRPGYCSGLPSHCPIPTPDAECRDSAEYGTGAVDTAC